jgi:hypothetical protein
VKPLCKISSYLIDGIVALTIDRSSHVECTVLRNGILSWKLIEKEILSLHNSYMHFEENRIDSENCLFPWQTKALFIDVHLKMEQNY